MNVSRIAIFLLLALILGVPFVLSPGRGQASDQGKEPTSTLVVVTPHVPQIRAEFAEGFDRWHRKHHGTGVRIDWRVPGGTSEIMKILEGVYIGAAKAGRFDFTDPKNPVCPQGTIDFDLMFGGGSFDHGRLKDGVRIDAALIGSGGGSASAADGSAATMALPMSVPAGFSQSQLDEWFGENRIGAQRLYDPEQFWIGTALSGFGIVYNRELLGRMGMSEPSSFEDLCDAKLIGQLTLADPRQSGSVTTTLDSILSNYGWERGWRILREMCANTRSYTNSSTKPPIDVSAGEAAAALAIDFYGRGQAQAVLAPGQSDESGRVGYVDPKGTTYIDADPASILRGGPSPELSKRFIEYCLTEEAQALWQFHARSSGKAQANPAGEDGEPMGPRVNELRRMPVRRVMFDKYLEFMIDRVNPFEVASDIAPKGWRSGLMVMMGAFGIDSAHEQRSAWRSLTRARNTPGFPAEVLAEMESLFYSWPETTLPTGEVVAFNEATYKQVSAVWKNSVNKASCEVAYTAHFRRVYKRVVELGAGN